MAYDPTDLATGAKTEIENDAKRNKAAAIKVVAAASRLDTVDPETAETRCTLAVAVLGGNQQQVIGAIYADLDPEEQNLLGKVTSRQLTPQRVEHLENLERQQSSQPQLPSSPAPAGGQAIEVRHDDKLVDINRRLLDANKEVANAFANLDAVLKTAEDDADDIKRVLPTSGTHKKVTKLVGDVNTVKAAHAKLATAIANLNALNEELKLHVGVLDATAKPSGT